LQAIFFLKVKAFGLSMQGKGSAMLGNQTVWDAFLKSKRTLAPKNRQYEKWHKNQ